MGNTDESAFFLRRYGNHGNARMVAVMIETMENATNMKCDASSNEALFVFLQTFVKQRKILCISNRSAAIHRIADIAASIEWLIIDDASAAPEIQGVQVAPFAPGPLPFDDETFEMIVVPAILAIQADIEELVVELRRVARADGLVVLGVVNSDSRRFEEISTLRKTGDELAEQGFFRLLEEHFATVTLLGQTPLFGYSVVDFSAAGQLSEISFDGSLVDIRTEVPQELITLCSQEDVTIEPYTVVQVPASSFYDAPSESDTEEAISDQDERTTHTEEVERLEASLRTCGEETRELRAEVDRRNVLVRDLVEQTQSNALVIERLTSECDRAVSRAVEAEAARLEAVLRLDEVCGQLKVAGVSPADIHTALENHCANLSGRVRGMQSRIAELEESRDAAEARLVLKEHDLEVVREKSLSLERSLEEMGERFELELARSSATTSSPAPDHIIEENIALKEKYEQAVERLSQAEKSVADLSEKNAVVESGTNELEDENASLRDRVEDLERDNAELESRISEYETGLEGERHKSSQAIAEKYQSESKLTDFIKELNGYRAKAQQLQEALDNMIDEKSRLIDALQAERSENESRISDAYERINGLLGALKEARGAFQKLSEVITNPEHDGSKSIGSRRVDVVGDVELSSNEE